MSALYDRIANLEIALATNRRIGMAIGVLMTTRQLTDAAAVELLRTASQHRGRKLRDLAEEVLLTGTVDLAPSSSPSSSPRQSVPYPSSPAADRADPSPVATRPLTIVPPAH
ncbi:MAG: ANTAR domain-containing protein [Jatrophihabitantaceae bacterium]